MIFNDTARPGPEEIELKGFNRSLAEIEWLLLLLILAAVVMPGLVGNPQPVLAACVAYAAFVIAFRYYNLFTLEARWKLSIETWVMIALTAFVIWHSGKTGSPLLNLYLLPIIFSALTLGKIITLLQVVLISALYLHAGTAEHGSGFFSQLFVSNIAFDFIPFVLVAYLASLLAADMSYARNFAQNLSETDELTGLPNMRAFRVSIAREKSRAEREGTRFSVIMIDADNLKDINDRLGHDVGNHLINHMVEAMKNALRSSDIIARYGGDEFIILLPNSGPEETREAAERIRQSIANMSFDASGQAVGTTISVGYAVYPDAATDLDALLMRADRAMYASKQAGRNQVSAYTHPG